MTTPLASLNVTAGSGGITFKGSDIITSGTQTFTSTSGGFIFNGPAASGTWQAGDNGINLLSTDLYLDMKGFTLNISVGVKKLVCRNFYFYNGSLNIAGVTVSTTEDFVVWGSGYSADDPDCTDADTRFAYYMNTAPKYIPSDANYANYVLSFSDTNKPSAAFISLADTNINVGNNVPNANANFYVNGANMNVGNFNLNIPDNSNSKPLVNSYSSVT